MWLCGAVARAGRRRSDRVSVGFWGLLSFLFIYSLRTFPVLIERDAIIVEGDPKVEVVRRRPIVGTLSSESDVLPRIVASVKDPVPVGLGMTSRVVTILAFVAAVGVVSRGGFNAEYFRGVQGGPTPVRLTTVVCSLFHVYHASMHAAFTVLIRLIAPVAGSELEVFTSPVVTYDGVVEDEINVLGGVSMGLVVDSSDRTNTAPLGTPAAATVGMRVAITGPPVGVRVLPPCRVVRGVSLPVMSIPGEGSLSKTLL